MTRALWFVVPLTVALGCSSPAEPTPVTEDTPRERVTVVEGTTKADLASLVGQQVTLIGMQTRTKIPTVCGVDVDGEYELSDTKVTATGVLRRDEVAPRGPDEPIVASRGPGVTYSLVDPAGGLAKTHPHAESD